MTTKKVYDARDANPIVLHAKQDPDSDVAHPLLVDADGGLMPAGKGVMTSRVVAVTTSAITITPTAGTKQMILSNIGAKPAYIGGSGVSNTEYAYAIYPRQAFDLGAVKSTFSIYAVCAAGETSTLGVGEYN